MPPQPTIPMLMRAEGAGRSSAPHALKGTNVGIATVAPAAARKRRRLTREFLANNFMFLNIQHPIFKIQRRSKLQNPSLHVAMFLDLGSSLDVGCWILDD